jgi:hypothetical protein
MENNINIILERQGVGFYALDGKLESSVKGRKYDRVTIRFSNRALSHRVVVSGVLSPSFITILNLFKYLPKCSYNSRQ